MDVVKRLRSMREHGGRDYECMDVAACEIENLRGLLNECLELSENWPGVAYSDDLEGRIRNAVTPNMQSDRLAGDKGKE